MSESSVSEIVRRNGTDPAIARRTFLQFGERRYTHAEYYAESIRWAHLFLALRDPERPFHVGVLLDNVPEYLFAFGAAALCGGVVVGINHTQRGASLARDIRHADCQFLLTESRHLALLKEIRADLGEIPDERLLVSRRHGDDETLPFGRDLDEAINVVRSRVGTAMYEDPRQPVRSRLRSTSRDHKRGLAAFISRLLARYEMLAR